MARSESKITQFLEITGVTRTQAVQLLTATNWVVEDAIQLFFTIGPDGLRHHNQARIRDQPRELHDVPTFLSSFVGSFDAAKARAQSKGKWLLANIQADESESHELNRNVWRNDEIQEILQKHYIFWQIYEHLEEGSKIMNWYKINKRPAVLILDPMTGYKKHHVEGSVDAQRMIEILSLYTEKGPLDGCIKRSEDGKTGGRIEYPALAREPATGAPGVVNVAFRLPYGGRVVRGFLATDPIQVLWSFASTQIKEDKDKEFELVSHTQGIKLNYDDQKSIAEAGVANSVLTLVLT